MKLPLPIRLILAPIKLTLILFYSLFYILLNLTGEEVFAEKIMDFIMDFGH